MYVELARKRRHGADIEVERESNPETQKTSVDDPASTTASALSTKLVEHLPNSGF